MTWKSKAAIAAVLVLIPSIGWADAAPSTDVIRTNSSAHLSAVALTAAAANRTVTMTLGDGTNGAWSLLKFGVQLTDADSSVVNLTLTPSCSYDGTTYYSETTRSCAAGTCTMYIKTDSYPASGSGNIEALYDVRGCATFRVVVDDSSGATAIDTVTTQAVAVVGD